MRAPPYDRKEAELLRAERRQIVACFECLREDRPKPYWPWQSVSFGGAMIYCKEHFDSVSLGKVMVGDWLGP